MPRIRNALLVAAASAALLVVPASAEAQGYPVEGAWSAQGRGHQFDFSVRALPTGPNAVHVFVVGLHVYGTKFPNIQVHHDSYFRSCIKRGLRGGGSARTCVRGHFPAVDAAQGDADYHRPGKSRSLNWVAGWSY